MHPRDDEPDEPYMVVEKRSGGLSSFLIGLAIGAGLALLFAPQSGAETRRKIARGAKRVRTAATGAVEGVSEKVGETLDAARERVAEQIDTARDAFTSKREHVGRAMRAGREAAEQARQDIEQRLATTKAAYQAGARVARESKGRDT